MGMLLLVGGIVPSYVYTPRAAAQTASVGNPVDAAASDAAAKQAILNSPSWAQAVDGFQRWLSVQITYPKAQVPQLLADFRARVDAMSAAQLQSFQADLLRKLEILKGPEAMEARAWAERRMNLYTDAKAAEFRKTLPDVFNMTSLQVEQALEDLRQQRASDAFANQQFAQFREQKVAAARARHQAQAAANAAAVASSNSFHPGFQGGAFAPHANTARTIQRYPGPVVAFGGWRW